MELPKEVGPHLSRLSKSNPMAVANEDEANDNDLCVNKIRFLPPSPTDAHNNNTKKHFRAAAVCGVELWMMHDTDNRTLHFLT